MQLILTILLVLIGSLAFGQHEITWQQLPPLTWDDFKGPIRNSKLAAETYCSINTEVSYSGGKLDVSVRAVFYSDSSWFNPEKIHDNTLLHEQGHFHIAEWYARKLRKAVKEQVVTFEDYQSRFETIYEDLHQAYLETQEQYDEETIHGTVGRMQQEWIDIIADELTALKQYEKLP